MSLPLLNFLIKKIKKNETANNDKTSTSFISLNFFPHFYTHTGTLFRIWKDTVVFKDAPSTHQKKVNIFIYLVLTGRQPLDV